MSGNALEEGLIGQVNNPSHTDVGRIAVPVGAVFGLLTYAGLSAALPILGITSKLIAAFGVFFTLYGLISRALNMRRMKAEVDALEARREIQNTETERQIAQMKKSG